jgi:hypothetical protein
VVGVKVRNELRRRNMAGAIRSSAKWPAGVIIFLLASGIVNGAGRLDDYFFDVAPEILKIVLCSLGILLVMLFFVLTKRYSETSPAAIKVQNARRKAESITYRLTNFFERIDEFELEVDKCISDIQAIDEGKGSIIYRNADFTLYVLYLETDQGFGGFINGASARFRDNTKSQEVKYLADSETTFEYDVNQRLVGSTTDFRTQTYVHHSGYASVEFSGPELVPGVLLFSNAEFAATVVNTFTQLVAGWERAKRLQKQHRKALFETYSTQLERTYADFGYLELLAEVHSCDSELIADISSGSYEEFLQLSPSQRVIAN